MAHGRSNLHLGVPAEDQKYAELRIPALLACRELAGVLWVSAEPLLGTIDLTCLRARGPWLSMRSAATSPARRSGPCTQRPPAAWTG
jgi:hypothetical protein